MLYISNWFSGVAHMNVMMFDDKYRYEAIFLAGICSSFGYSIVLLADGYSTGVQNVATALWPNANFQDTLLWAKQVVDSQTCTKWAQHGGQTQIRRFVLVFSIFGMVYR